MHKIKKKQIGRPLKKRCCRNYQADRVFKPLGIPMKQLSETAVSLDEFEALRLCDFENFDQIEAGEKMGVSRGTVQRLLYSGRSKLIEAILSNNSILIQLKEEV